MKLQDSTIFITGANCGLGLEFARQALARGARKVYAGARDPSQVTLPGVIPIAPEFVVARTFEALEAGASEVAVDEWTQQIKRGLSAEPGIYIDYTR